jgi:hypothetical protein
MRLAPLGMALITPNIAYIYKEEKDWIISVFFLWKARVRILLFFFVNGCKSLELFPRLVKAYCTSMQAWDSTLYFYFIG